MPTIIHGDNGVTFPDSTVQGTALTTGAQNITGQKTFLSAPIFNAPPVSAATPAFIAYGANGQVISAWTKLQLGTEVFDATGAYDNTTNFRFNPQVAGYYQLNGKAIFNTAVTTLTAIAFYKNGSVLTQGPTTSGASVYNIAFSDLVYLNGSSDYVELWVYASATLGSGAYFNTFTGALVARSA